MKLKRIMAAGLAVAMAMSGSVVALAEEGTGTGTGKLEGTVETDVFNVVLPTVTTQLDFTLDPEGLIAKTSAAAYSAATFDAGTLFFKNTGGSNDYSSTSDEIKVENKSSVKADVTLSAVIKDYDGITLTSDKTFADDTSASMYMAIVDKTNTDGVAIGDSGATVTAEIAAAPEGAYKYSYDSSGQKYKYELDSGFSGTFASYEFQLTGASNAAGDWSKLESVAPKVELTWTVVAHSDAYVSSTTLSVGSESVTLNMPEGVSIQDVVLNKVDGTKVTLTSGNTYTLSANTLSIKAAIVSAYPGATITVKYSDSHVDTLTIG